MVAFSRTFRRAGFVNRRVLALAGWNGLIFHLFGADEKRMRAFRESALRITRGWDRNAVTALVNRTLTEVIDPIVYDEALELIRRHHEEGRLVYIISASPEEIVRPLATYLGADGAIASRARLDDSHRYTGEVEFYAYGEFKALAIEELAAEKGIDLSRSWAYSDSATDEPMLRAVGHPIAVNPDRDLARLAETEGWPIVEFHTGVPLRERVALPATRHVLAGAGIGATVIAAVVTVWWVTSRSGDDHVIRRLGAS